MEVSAATYVKGSKVSRSPLLWAAHVVNLMDSLPVLWYLESHLLGLKHVGMAALVHSNLKSLLSEPQEDSCLSGEPGRKGCSGSFQQSN